MLDNVFACPGHCHSCCITVCGRAYDVCGTLVDILISNGQTDMKQLGVGLVAFTFNMEMYNHVFLSFTDVSHLYFFRSMFSVVLIAQPNDPLDVCSCSKGPTLRL